MDNDPNVVPQGQATPVESPVAESVPTTPSEAPVAVPTEPATPSTESSAFAELAAKKGFKTPDDLAKAYANLESQNTKVSMKSAELEKLFFTETKQDIVPQKIEPQVPQEEQKALAELKQFVNKEAVEPLQRQFEQRLKTELAKIELNQVLRETPDFANYASQVKELKTKYPDMPFQEAYTFAKALKGDLQSEATARAYSEGAKVGYKQVAAQVAPTKPVAEDKIAASDLVTGAGSRWKVNPSTTPAEKARIRAEQALVERELFGQELGGLKGY